MGAYKPNSSLLVTYLGGPKSARMVGVISALNLQVVSPQPYNPTNELKLQLPMNLQEIENDQDHQQVSQVVDPSTEAWTSQRAS